MTMCYSRLTHPYVRDHKGRFGWQFVQNRGEEPKGGTDRDR